MAVFVTPNRLTFGLADEIVDPYHHVEFSPQELRRYMELEHKRWSAVVVGAGLRK